jgi:hypothetical protein
MPHQILFGLSNEGEWDGQGIWNSWEGWWGENMNERANLEEVCIERKTKLKCIFKKYNWKSWICSISSQYSDKWQALVNVVMSLWVPHNVGNFLTSLGTNSFSKITLFYGVKIVDHLDSKSVCQISQNIPEIMHQVWSTNRQQLFPEVDLLKWEGEWQNGRMK